MWGVGLERCRLKFCCGLEEDLVYFVIFLVLASVRLSNSKILRKEVKMSMTIICKLHCGIVSFDNFIL